MRKPVKVLLYVLFVCLGLLGTAAVCLIFFFQLYRVPQEGMYPTIRGRQAILVKKRPYADAGEVRRGDIVVFQRSEKGKVYDHIWRVVGLPGDTLVMTESVLSLNGTELKREKVRSEGNLVIFRESLDGVSYLIAQEPGQPLEKQSDFTLVVPAGQFFVLGDNRDRAYDSRFFGPIRFDSIIGKKL